MVFAGITYAACYLWHALARSSFNDSVFAAAFPGFSWSVVGFVTGLALCRYTTCAAGFAPSLASVAGWASAGVPVHPSLVDRHRRDFRQLR